MAKDKAAGGAKKPKTPKKPAAAASSTAMSVSAHPRAAYAVRRAKGTGGLAGLVLVGLLSLRAGTPAVDAGARALAGGAAGYVTCWTLAVQVWRHLVLAEARAAAERARARAAEAAS